MNNSSIKWASNSNDPAVSKMLGEKWIVLALSKAETVHEFSDGRESFGPYRLTGVVHFPFGSQAMIAANMSVSREAGPDRAVVDQYRPGHVEPVVLLNAYLHDPDGILTAQLQEMMRRNASRDRFAYVSLEVGSMEKEPEEGGHQLIHLSLKRILVQSRQALPLAPSWSYAWAGNYNFADKDAWQHSANKLYRNLMISVIVRSLIATLLFGIGAGLSDQSVVPLALFIGWLVLSVYTWAKIEADIRQLNLLKQLSP